MPSKTLAKKRPDPTKKSQVMTVEKAQAHPDDVTITALDLAPGKLSRKMAAYFKKCEEKLGYVPNVLKAFAFDDAKLQAFVDYRQELVQNAANLSKLEIEMIATVVSSQNRCFYCITAHGNAVRQLGDPVLGEMMVPSEAGIEIYVRNKRPAEMNAFQPERTLLFVHGATYPAHTSFDLKLDGLSWMEYIAARGYDVYLLDLRGYGKSTRPKEMDEKPALVGSKFCPS